MLDGPQQLPKSATRTVEAQGNGEKTTCTEIGQDGSEGTYGYTANYDGKDYPISGSGRSTWHHHLLNGAETIALNREGSNSYGGVLKKSINAGLRDWVVHRILGQVGI